MVLRGMIAESVEQSVREAFYRFLHPTVGGPEGEGWPLGRPLFASEVMGVLQRISGLLEQRGYLGGRQWCSRAASGVRCFS